MDQKRNQDKENKALRRYLKRPSQRRLAAVARQLYDHVWHMAFRMSGNHQDATDLCQDVFLSLLNKPPKPGDVHSARGYLTARTATAARNRRRSAERRRHREMEAARRMVDSDACLPEDVGAIREAVDDLPGRIRTAIELKYLGCLSHRQIAESLGVSESTVDADLRHGREILRDKLGRAGIGALLTALFAAHEGAAAPPSGLLAGLLETINMGSVLTTTGNVILTGGMIMSGKKLAIAVAAAVLLMTATIVTLFLVSDENGDKVITDQSQGADHRDHGKEKVEEKGSKPVDAGLAARDKKRKVVLRRKVKWVVMEGETGRPVVGASILIRHVAASKDFIPNIGEVEKLRPERDFWKLVPDDVVGTTNKNGMLVRSMRPGTMFGFFISAAGLTSASGFAHLERDEPGTEYRLENLVSKPRESAAVTFVQNREGGEIQVRLEPAASTAITVIDQFEAPVDAVEVVVRDCETGRLVECHAPRNEAGAIITDANGTLRIQGVPLDRKTRFEVSGARSDGARIFPLFEEHVFTDPELAELVLQVKLGATLCCEIDLSSAKLPVNPVLLVKEKVKNRLHKINNVEDMDKSAHLQALYKNEERQAFEAMLRQRWPGSIAPLPEDAWLAQHDHSQKARLEMPGKFVIGPLEPQPDGDAFVLVTHFYPTELAASLLEKAFVAMAGVPHLQAGRQDLTMSLVEAPMAPVMPVNKPRHTILTDVTVRVLDESGQPMVTRETQHMLSVVLLTNYEEMLERGRVPHEFHVERIPRHDPPVTRIPFTLVVYLGAVAYSEAVKDMKSGEVYEVRIPSSLLEGRGTIVTHVATEDGRPFLPDLYIRAAGRRDRFMLDAKAPKYYRIRRRVEKEIKSADKTPGASREEVFAKVNAMMREKMLADAAPSAEMTFPMLTPGEYTVGFSIHQNLLLEVPGEGRYSAPEVRVVVKPGETTEVHLVARAARTITGRLEPHDAENPCRLVYLTGKADTGEACERTAEPDKEGRFEFKRMSNGNYTCNAASPGGAYGPARVLVNKAGNDNEVALMRTDDAFAVSFKRHQDVEDKILFVAARRKPDNTLWWSMPHKDWLQSRNYESFWKDARAERFDAHLPPGDYAVSYCFKKKLPHSWLSRHASPLAVRTKSITVGREAMTVVLD